MLAAAQQSVSTAIEGSNLFRPPNVHVGVCHWVWRPICSAPRCVPNKPVEFPSTRSYLVDCTGVAQRSSALRWLESFNDCVKSQHVFSFSLSQLKGRSSTRSTRMRTASFKELGRVTTPREVNRNWKSEQHGEESGALKMKV